MLFLSALNLAPASFFYQISPESGLQLSLDGVPVVRGSWFQYYAPGWAKGYYSSSHNSAKITHPTENSVEATWTSDDGLTNAKETVTRDEGKLHVHYSFDWGGESPAKIEFAAANFWAPALTSGVLTEDGKPTRSLQAKAYHSQSWSDRRYGEDSNHFELQVPFGNIRVSSSTPLTLLDGRDNFQQDWAEGNDLLWLGAEDLTVEKGHTTSVDVDWQLDTATIAPPSEQVVTEKVAAQADPAAYEVPEVHPPLIPRPKKSNLDWDHPLEITGAWAFPAGRFAHLAEFKAALERRFVLPKSDKLVNIDGGISKLGLVPGAYRITIRPNGISVVGEKDEGFRYGLQRIARLAFVRGGKLYVPTGELFDEPVNTFRGVHLFVGPKSLEFQKKLVERVLMPLGMNKVVLQCERSAWKTLPGTETDETMSLEQLQSLFKMYRDFGFEPIPLLESFGHDPWMFANGKNLDLAMDPKVPYVLDPRKPRTKELLNQLWAEVINLLQPETIHFGLDEIELRGFPVDTATKTALWKAQLATLGDIAKSHNVKMMLWGDELLGPTEAVDAVNGDTAQDAADRRDAVPQGAMITDWHYIADPDPARYMSSLLLFAKQGFKPIASPWYKPENVRGFDLAAVSGGFGTLQTTWAGYTSSEESMIENINQFAAMVLAADYGWSGRQDTLADLDYDYSDVFRQMYFGSPIKPETEAGKTFSAGAGSTVRIGSVEYRLGEPIQLRSNATSTGAGAPSRVEISIGAPATSLALALSVQLPSAEGEKVGEVGVLLADGKLLVQPLIYGHQLRARDDGKACLFADRRDGVCSVIISLGLKPALVKSVRLLEINQYSGLQILGATTY